MRKLHLFFISFGCALLLSAQKIDHVAPKFWWTGMKTDQIELMLHGKDIGTAQFLISDPRIQLIHYTRTDNPNYAFLNLKIQKDALPGLVPIYYQLGAQQYMLNYELRARVSNRKYGLDASDVIYLITPDRFANGDPTNDVVNTMLEKTMSRDSIYGRHGGDLQGVTRYLDYVKNLGATATWLNPVNENNMPVASYHGYAITNQYEVDPRLGGNEAYKDYVRKSHSLGLKVVNDVVFNHVGIEHYLYRDMPDSTFFHPYKPNNFRAVANVDPYASEKDKSQILDGWFTPDMPDINQKNDHFANYLIQHAIWWIEEYGVDAYRIDTYGYPDQEFMANLTETITNEYPDFTLFGEVWESKVPTQVWFTEGKHNGKNFDSHLQGVTDFELYHAMLNACNQDFNWTDGVMQLYYTLSSDYQYKNPMSNVIFLDNHDLGRFLGKVNNDVGALKMMTSFLLTTRGIPQYFYGTEYLMNQTENHGVIRSDFQGGWENDFNNKFIPQGRTLRENDYFQYTQNLMQWRKTATAIHNGKLKHFIPHDGVYTYFRYNDQQTVMVIINSSKEEKTVDLSRFSEVLNNFKYGVDVQTQKKFTLDSLQMEPRSALVAEILN